MKRTLCIVLALVLVLSIVPAAFADVDLSGMSFDELVALKDQINLALWNSADWQEVEVPQGVWKVGEDIPAGKWTIKATEAAYTSIDTGTGLSEDGTKIPITYYLATKTIVSPTHKRYDPVKNVTEWTVELHDGEYVIVDSGPAVFTPYAGKPSLGFK